MEQLGKTRERQRTTTNVGTRSRTKQAPRDQTNINTIMAKYAKTGVIDHLNRAPAQYGDFSRVVEYREALEIVCDAEAQFEALPADVRRACDNDPEQLLTLLATEEGSEKLIKAGLKLEERPEPIQVQVANGDGLASKGREGPSPSQAPAADGKSPDGDPEPAQG